MNLLVASYAYPPLRYPRAIQVARLVAQLPPETTSVVCASEPGDGDRTLLDAYPDDGRQVLRVPWGRFSRVLRRLRNGTVDHRLAVPDRFRPWQRDAGHAIRHARLLRRGDVLVTFGQPMSDHLLGLRLARTRRAKWIAHFSDPWVDSPFRSGGRLTQRLNQWLEARVIAEADAVVFTSQETVELVMAKYPRALRNKVHVIPHAYDEQLYVDGAERGSGVLARYVGNFYGHRGPEPLLHALQALVREHPETLEDVRIELVGSQEHAVGADLLGALPPALVSIRDPVDYTDSLALMRGSDLLLVLDAPGEQSVFLPSKLIDYLGAHRPIVALTPAGAAADLVRRAGGWQADPADADACATALADAFTAVRTGTMSEAPPEVVDAFSAPAVGARFRELLARVAG